MFLKTAILMCLLIVGGVVIFITTIDNRTHAEIDKEELFQAKNKHMFIFNNINYFKDKRTGLCFATESQSLGGIGQTISYVPCTIEVEALLTK